MEGTLTGLDCTAAGVHLLVTSGGAAIRFEPVQPSELEFVSYRANVADEIVCGPFETTPPVRIIYLAGTDDNAPGVPDRVEFLPE